MGKMCYNEVMKNIQSILPFFVFFVNIAAFGAAKIEVTTVNLPTYGFSDPDFVPKPHANYWPYYRYDGFTDKPSNRVWQAVILENDEIRITILPEVGGKIWGAVEKREGKDFIYYNHVAKFRDISMCGPWTSGGIEFNFGITGHGPYTSLPVDWTVRENPEDGSVSYFCGLTEMICRTTWQVEVRLPAKGGEFTTSTVWHNSSNLSQPYYQWMNGGFGVKRQNPQFFFPGRNQLGHPGDPHPWPLDEQGRDCSVYSNNAFGVRWLGLNDMDHKSYHVMNGDNRVFAVWWPDDRLGMYHLNEADAKYGRKIWMWGLSRSGGVWEDLLTDADGQYVELQSGRCFQQPQGDCWKTPFNYRSFAPGLTDVFSERWGFVRDRATLERFASEDPEADRPVSMPEGFKWDSAYGLWMKAKQAVYSGQKKASKRQLEKGDPIALFEAEKLLGASLAADPCFTPSLDLLAELLVRRGETEKARELLRRSLAVDTYGANANYLDGFIALEEGKFLRARERLGMAAYSPSVRSAALALTARSFLAEGDWSRAVEAAKRALAADACSRDAVWALIAAMRNSGERDSAVRLVEGAIGRLPLCHAFRYEAWKLGVEKDFTAVIKNHAPAETLMELGALYASSGLAEDAREIYSRAKGNILAAVRIAYLSRDVEALEAASKLPTDLVHPYCREDFSALRWASEKGRSWKFDYLYSLLLASVGRDAEADLLLAGCAGKPDSAAFYLFRASRSKGEAALSDIDRAEKIDDGWRTALARYNAFVGVDDWRNALLSLKAALGRYSGNPGIQINYARALVKNGKYAEAVRFLESIRFLPSEVGENPRPIYQEALVALAGAALESGDGAAAREYVRKALIFPETLGSGRSFNWKRIAESWPENVRRLADDIR